MRGRGKGVPAPGQRAVAEGHVVHVIINFPVVAVIGVLEIGVGRVALVEVGPQIPVDGLEDEVIAAESGVVAQALAVSVARGIRPLAVQAVVRQKIDPFVPGDPVGHLGIGVGVALGEAAHGEDEPVAVRAIDQRAQETHAHLLVRDLGPGVGLGEKGPAKDRYDQKQDFQHIRLLLMFPEWPSF